MEHGDRALAEGGGIAFVSQSGSVGVEALGLASNTGFPMRAFVGLGNKIDLNELDFLKFFGADYKTDCLSLYIENVEQGREFLEDARKVSRRKPVIALKAGGFGVMCTDYIETDNPRARLHDRSDGRGYQ